MQSMIHVVIVFQGIYNNISLDILGVTFDSKMTFEKQLRSVSNAASQRLGILRTGEYSVIDCFFGDAYVFFLSCPFRSSVLHCGAPCYQCGVIMSLLCGVINARLPIQTLNY